MPDPTTTAALRQFAENRELRLPLRRRDILGRLVLRFLWRRYLKWQVESNVAACDALHGLAVIADGHQTHLGQIEDRIAGETHNREDLAGTVRELREQHQHLVAGVNQRLYSTIGDVRAQLSDLRLNSADAETAAMDTNKRLASIEERITELAASVRDVHLRQSRLNRRLESEPAPAPENATTAQGPDRNGMLEFAVADVLDGPVELARERRALHLPTVRAAREDGQETAVFDMAPGRGEWLEVLRDAGIPYRAASANHEVVNRSEELGLTVEDGDPLRTLAEVSARSLAAVTAFRFVERLDASDLPRFVEYAAVALRPGGVLVVETPTVDGAGDSDFHRDPLARLAVHPDLVRYLGKVAGFESMEVHDAGAADARAGYAVMTLRR